MWATCNVGASSPEDYGDYFAWGETIGYNGGKTVFTWNTYKWCNGSATTLTKYSNDAVEYKTELDSDDDAAYFNWGSNWRMPSDYQISELRENCTWTWITLNGVNGFMVTGTNGNYIFLPAAGGRYDSDLYVAGLCGGYWSRTLFANFQSWACGLYFSREGTVNDGELTEYINERRNGLSVRPVLNTGK